MKRTLLPIPLVGCFLSAEGILYLAFLILDISGQGRNTFGLKYTGILFCLIFTSFCLLFGGDCLVALALLFTAGADWFLLIRNAHLLLGVVLFLCVQGLYFLRLHRTDGSRSLLWLRLALTPVLVLPPALIPGMATPLNFLAMFYFSQLLSNTILAWTLPTMRTFALGLTLFVGCDICVGLFHAFVLSPALFLIVSVGMWFFYLPSQVLIALSALPKETIQDENK